MSSDERRIGHLAGAQDGALPPHERAHLDELRRLLASGAVWVEARPQLEDAVVTAITMEAWARGIAGAGMSSPWTRLSWKGPRFSAAAAAVAVALAAVAIVVGVGGASRGPERLAMIVTGTALAPDARGEAMLTKAASGWQIDLRVRGLPHLSGVRYYEAWLTDGTGTLVPVGTFNDARAVTLWSGVPATHFSMLTVTVQTLGEQRSSGHRVLAGRIGT